MTASHFKELDVWQVAMSLAGAVYKLTADFPKEERYGLSAQMQRAAVSIPSNIAEGNARQSTRDYARFIAIASGSAAELQTQLLLAQQLGVAGDKQIKPVLTDCDRVGRMLLQLHRALHQRMDVVPESRVPSPESRLLPAKRSPSLKA